MTASPDRVEITISWLKRLWPLIALLAAMAFVFAMGWHRYLTIETLAENREALRALIGTNMLLSLAVFVAVYGAASILGATIGASIVFLIARSALGDLLAARAGPWLSRFRQGFQEDAFSYLLFLRLVPIFPFWLVNLAPGLLGVSFATYVATTILGIIPGTFAFALAGNGLDSVVEAQQAAHQSCLAKMGPEGQESCSYVLDPGALLTPELIAGLVALGLVALIPVAVKWFRRPRA